MAIALTIAGCKGQDKKEESNTTPAMVTTTISGCFADNGTQTINLQLVADDFTAVERVASTQLTTDGEFGFEIAIEEGTSPRFYLITANADNPDTEDIVEQETLITLVVAPGDNISLHATDDIINDYTVTGSDESQLIKEFETAYLGAYNTFVEQVDGERNKEAIATATAAMRKQLEFVITHADKLASIYALNTRLFEQHIPMLASKGINHIHYKTVRDAIAKSYPTSPYIATLERSIELATMIANAPEVSYPNITLSDINRNIHSLTDNKGKVTLLCFWSAQDQLSTLFIGEFKEIYKRYHDAGLEAYFVSADSNRVFWIESVRMQKHPWVSVFGGDNPSVFSMYNVDVVPLAFIIDREGNMKSATLIPDELDKMIKELL